MEAAVSTTEIPHGSSSPLAVRESEETVKVCISLSDAARASVTQVAEHEAAAPSAASTPASNVSPVIAVNKETATAGIASSSSITPLNTPDNITPVISAKGSPTGTVTEHGANHSTTHDRTHIVQSFLTSLHSAAAVTREEDHSRGSGGVNPGKILVASLHRGPVLSSPAFVASSTKAPEAPSLCARGAASGGGSPLFPRRPSMPRTPLLTLKSLQPKDADVLLAYSVFADAGVVGANAISDGSPFTTKSTSSASGLLGGLVMPLFSIPEADDSTAGGGSSFASSQRSSFMRTYGLTAPISNNASVGVGSPHAKDSATSTSRISRPGHPHAGGGTRRIFDRSGLLRSGAGGLTTSTANGSLSVTAQVPHEVTHKVPQPSATLLGVIPVDPLPTHPHGNDGSISAAGELTFRNDTSVVETEMKPFIRAQYTQLQKDVNVLHAKAYKPLPGVLIDPSTFAHCLKRDCPEHSKKSLRERAWREEQERLHRLQQLNHDMKVINNGGREVVEPGLKSSASLATSLSKLRSRTNQQRRTSTSRNLTAAGAGSFSRKPSVMSFHGANGVDGTADHSTTGWFDDSITSIATEGFAGDRQGSSSARKSTRQRRISLDTLSYNVATDALRQHRKKGEEIVMELASQGSSSSSTCSSARSNSPELMRAKKSETKGEKARRFERSGGACTHHSHTSTLEPGSVQQVMSRSASLRTIPVSNAGMDGATEAQLNDNHQSTVLGVMSDVKQKHLRNLSRRGHMPYVSSDDEDEDEDAVPTCCHCCPCKRPENFHLLCAVRRGSGPSASSSSSEEHHCKIEAVEVEELELLTSSASRVVSSHAPDANVDSQGHHLTRNSSTCGFLDGADDSEEEPTLSVKMFRRNSIRRS